MNNAQMEMVATAPCFKATMSAGDRSALALAFFCATVKNSPNYSNRIVILDDPFSSQDRFRRTATQYIIAGLARDCEQVIVLSHDPLFLKAIEQEAQPSGVARLQITAVGEAVEISQCNLDAIIECPLAAERTRLSTYISGGQGTPIDVVRSIRPMLERFLRQAVPVVFSGTYMLGDIINTIRAAAPGDVIYRFSQHADE